MGKDHQDRLMGQYMALIERALEELWVATEEMLQPTYPRTPSPRPRIFHFLDGNHGEWPDVWKDREGTTHVKWDRILSVGGFTHGLNFGAARRQCADEMVAQAKHPSGALRAVRRIQAATAWCRARREGRLRAAREILRQQARAVETLEAEAAINALS